MRPLCTRKCLSGSLAHTPHDNLFRMYSKEDLKRSRWFAPLNWEPDLASKTYLRGIYLASERVNFQWA
ncbi:hypothetical protein PROFUN_09546 [Planoprotostelium fungivorum]|uniref:Uncharacterized protein n=1 Tax=Planoprotostelium fungivorum TaxID=1890364 RepID=A0A2P6MT23_9EUKA|nr:hypothetical protein PROFUN_09546 [Planoprotostelium fungivorum]